MGGRKDKLIAVPSRTRHGAHQVTRVLSEEGLI